jgi:tripartite-type tricarboxylate transporter receptor subunit TctC
LNVPASALAFCHPRVPFTGSAPATAALLGGHVDMSFDIMPSIWSSVQAGKLRHP